MRYPAGYKEQKRKELLKISGKLAKQQGFVATGVDSFMHAAGVTSGAFYSHFSSKQNLFQALIESELQHSLSLWQNNPHQNAQDWANFELDRYLALSHVQQSQQGCVLPALVSEISRADHSIKQAFEQEMQRGHTLFTQHLGCEKKAWAMICQLVGAISMARSMADPALQQSILDANKSVIQQYLMTQKNETSNTA